MKKHWITLSIVAVVILGAVTAAFFLSKPQGDAVMASLNMTAAQTTDMGVALESSFDLTSNFRVTEKDLRAMIEVEPAVEYKLTGSGKNWGIIPVAPLEDNTVYTFRVKNKAGETVRSFAFQTKSDLAVNTVYPADEETYVTPDAGIEITFNATDVNLKDYFEIKPEVEGTFETTGYTVIFKPSAPLSQDNIYRVTLKKGLTAPNGMTLTEDYAFSFETTDSKSGKWDYTRLRLTGEYSETFLTGDPLAVELSSGSNTTGQKYDIKVHKYADIKDYINELKAHDTYYEERYGRKSEYVADTTGLEEVASFNGELFEKAESWGTRYAILPENLPQGHYIVTVSGKDTEGNEQFVQKLIQICSLSIYSQSIDGDTLVWLNDPVTGEPLADRKIYLTDAQKEEDSKELTTQSDGTARVMTGETENAYLSVMDGNKVICFEKLMLSKQEDQPLSERFYTALYTDREIYQPDDTIRFWGVIKPRRPMDAVPTDAYAALLSSWPESKIYNVKLDVNSDGTFEGKMEISGLKKNWYNFAITDGEKGTYTQKSFSIGEYTKPPYVITVKTDKEHYYANEQIKFDISAAYFDGTPVAGGKLRLSSYQMGLRGEDEKGIVTLDASGKGSITASYANDGGNLPNWQPQSVWYDVSNVDAEDVYIHASGSVTVLPSRVAAKIESTKPSELTVYTAQLDPSKLKDGGIMHPRIYPNPIFDRLKGASVDLPVIVKVHKVEYVETPVGSYYDYVNKKTITKYKYDRKETLADTIKTQTTGGKVTLSNLPYENKENVNYWFEVQFAGGVLGDVTETYHYFRPYQEFISNGRKTYSFVDQNGIDTKQTADLGGEIMLGLYENGVKIENKGRVLYSIVQRKALTSGIYTESDFKVTMEEDFLPNVCFAGAYFDGRHVFTIQNYNVSYKYDSKRLKVDVSADKEAYKPGEKATVTLTVTDADGKPAVGTVCVGVVDEAVFAIAQQEVNFAEQLYRDVFYPNIQQRVSYVEYNLEKAMMNDGGMGGGGGDDGVIRENFVDTALFQTIKTDASGKATVALELPDNITSWRITAAAVTEDLKAGDNLTNRIVTLPFYLQPLFTDSYLEGDDIAMAIGSVGTATKMGDKVDYTVTIHDAKGAEIDKLTASGKVGERTTFNFGKYSAGTYSMTVTGKCGENSDAVKQEFSVIKQGIIVPIIQNMPLEDVSKLESVRYPIGLTIYDERMESYMTALQNLSAQTGDRTEIIAAAYRARVIYNELLEEKDREKIRRDSRLDEIQVEEGGIKLLPFSEADAAVTAKMLVAAPELIDQLSAANFLQAVLKDPTATPDDRVMAYMGLAAMKKPVLYDITKLESESTLTTSQRLYLGVGLAKLGDFTGAEKIYASLGNALVTEGKLKYVEGDGTAETRLQNTAAALMLTSITSNPDADALIRFFHEAETDRAKNYKVLYNMEELTYVEHFSVPKGKDAAKFSYTVDGKTQEVELGELGFKPISMSYEAMQGANFKVLSGKVYAGVSYMDYASSTDIPENSKVKIEKIYTPVSGEMKTTQKVKVELKVTFDKDAPSGCYNITDYIPSGMRYMPAQDYKLNPRNDWCWSSVEDEGQRVYGYIYRDKKQEELPDVRDESMMVDVKMIPFPQEGEEPEGEQADPNVYTLTYYVSASLAGEFVTESAYITPHTEGIAAKSARGKITIK
ncbi:Ig-like domain-containing protein [Oscillospiraceae bacterium PP1C4]